MTQLESTISNGVQEIENIPKPDGEAKVGNVIETQSLHRQTMTCI